MRIAHNIMALNTWRNLNQTSQSLSKTLERLSSGLRINRAADDAAGLAISEKMRAQIRGLNQAVRNAQDTISLIQTGEGALTEVHTILQRMRELANQAASDALKPEDRAQIQAEMDQLAQEITRITNTTEFNKKNLLAGGFSGQRFMIGANPGQFLSFSIDAMDAYSLGVAADRVTALSNNQGVTNVRDIGSALTKDSYTIDLTYTAASAGTVTQSNSAGGAGTAVATNFTGTKEVTFIVRLTSVDASGNVTGAEYSVDGGQTWTTAAVSSGTVTLADGAELQIAGDTNNAAGDLYTVTFTPAKATLQLKDGSNNIGVAATVNYGTSSVTIGDPSKRQSLTVDLSWSNISANATVTLTFGRERSKAATVVGGEIVEEAVAAKGLSVMTSYESDYALSQIDKAIEKVSTQRDKLGALQNRLEHTIANLSVAAENLSAAESRIRDADMAQEMMNFVRQQILLQSGTAMLAQANLVPQTVLQLLA